MTADEKYGGMGMDIMSVGVVIEEFGKVDIGAAHAVLVPTQCCALFESASEAQREIWLPRLCRGELMPSLAITEAGCGTDAAAISMNAIRDGDHYVLDGEKAPVTRGMQADTIIVWAKTDPEAGARGVSCFFVPSDTKGLSFSEIPYGGQILLNCATVSFDAVKIPANNRIGEEGKGFYMLMDRFDVIRVLLGLVALGQAQSSLREIITYTKGRVAFGRPIAKYEGISFKIAEAATRIDAARLLCYRALWMRDKGLRHSKESAMCKWYAPAVAFDVIHDAVLMMGHYGYSTEYPYTQRLLDVMGYKIADGTAEAQKLVIVREMIGKEFLPYR
jgi:cyclohexanecarboxyl-CoA dehydrogenase